MRASLWLLLVALALAAVANVKGDDVSGSCTAFVKLPYHWTAPDFSNSSANVQLVSVLKIALPSSIVLIWPCCFSIHAI
jgi:hypothetical protein